MTTLTHAAPPGDWQIDRLDLDAYLKRIGYAATAPATDASTLRALHRAHAATIPFENLDIVLGRTIELDLDHVQGKLIRDRRGGYCFEHNLLFAAVLERLGFAVTRLAARVRPAGAGPRTHMLLRVVADGDPWLADVGFGASLLEPLPMESTIARQGAWTYRLEDSGPGEWLLQSRHPDEWSQLYAFTLEAQRPIDYAVYNHYTATHPRSPFTGQVVALRTDPQIQHALRGRELTTTRPDGTSESLQLTADEALGVLADLYGIRLGADDVATLREHWAAPRILSGEVPYAPDRGSRTTL